MKAQDRNETHLKRILIIEDELEMLRNLMTILRLEKFRPLSAENGQLGLDLAKQLKPDLILCDVTMSGLDGYGVIAALRADVETVGIPFIFLSAKAEKPDIHTGMNLGADEYITKPVAKADLLAAIRWHLGRATPQPEPNSHFTVPPPAHSIAFQPRTTSRGLRRQEAAPRGNHFKSPVQGVPRGTTFH
jgi:DNA-binding response OmpR family regulator